MRKNDHFTTICIIYATTMLLLVLLRLLVGLGCFNGCSDELAEILLNGVLSQILIMFGVPFVMFLVSKKMNHEEHPFQQMTRDVGWHRLSVKSLLLVVILGVCLYLLNIFVSSFFGSILQSFGYQYPDSENTFHGVGGLFLSLFLSAVLPGFCEEFLHRGVLLKGAIKQYGVKKALILVSVLFGLMHMNVGQFFYATVLGWFMGVTVLATGSLWGSMIVHFINNAIATYFSYAEELSLPGLNEINYLFANPVLTILTLLVVVVAVGGILRTLARDNFERHLDAYVVRYLAIQDKFDTTDFDQLKTALPKVIKTMPTWKATMTYVETFDEPHTTKPLAKSILTALVVMCGLITVFTFVWGTW